MVNNSKYAIMALIFVGLAKLIQVTAFDADKYNKNKKTSFSSVKVQAPEKLKPKEQPKKKREVEKQAESDSAFLEVSADTINTQPVASTSDVTTASKPTNEGRSLNALKNNYLAPIVAKLPAGQLREDVVVRYYRHDLDEGKVYTLRDMGYYIHEKEATETAGLGSNIIYYGKDVNVEDIQIVAYTLLEQGLPLKSISPTRFEWKSNAIEIGTDTLLLESPTLTKEAVRQFKK
ncbi:MAG: hypothetical protein Tsb0034_05920 [Ekhidna sp.]